MTEAEWLVCENPNEMLREGVVPTLSMRNPRSREFDLLCAVCARLVWDLLPDDVKQAVEWLEETAGRGYEDDREAWERHSRTLNASGFSPGGRDKAPGAYIVRAAWVRRYSVAFHHLYRHIPPDREADTTKTLTDSIRDIFGNPFRPVSFDPAWRTSTVVALARGIYDERAFDRMPILADALQDAGCDNDDVLNHCRGGGPHLRGCWVVDLLLGKA